VPKIITAEPAYAGVLRPVVDLLDGVIQMPLKRENADRANSVLRGADKKKPPAGPQRAGAAWRSAIEQISKKAPRQDEVFRLGHASTMFGSYAKIVDEQWPNILAVEYHAVVLHFDRAMRQSPLWREFKRNAEQSALTPQQVSDALSLGTEAAEALRADEASAFAMMHRGQNIETAHNNVPIHEIRTTRIAIMRKRALIFINATLDVTGGGCHWRHSGTGPGGERRLPPPAGATTGAALPQDARQRRHR
jgi:hypothetical protein